MQMPVAVAVELQYWPAGQPPQSLQQLEASSPGSHAALGHEGSVHASLDGLQ